MNIKRGFIRIFILLSCVAMFAGGIAGYDYAENKWAPPLNDYFSKTIWNEKNISKYYSTASAFSEKGMRLRELEKEWKELHLRGKNLSYSIKNQSYAANLSKEDRSFLLKIGPHDKLLIEKVNKTNLSDYRNVPPAYNENVFIVSFPEVLKTPLSIYVFSILIGAAGAFFATFLSFLSIMTIIIWLVNGFKTTQS